MIFCTSGTIEKGIAMECFVLLILFVFIAIVTSGFGLGTRPHGRARAKPSLHLRA